MKIKNGFEVAEVCGVNVIIAHGVDNIDYTDVTTLNDTAAELWHSVEGKEFTTQNIADTIVSIYDVDEATALADAETLVNKWFECGLIEK